MNRRTVLATLASVSLMPFAGCGVLNSVEDLYIANRTSSLKRVRATATRQDSGETIFDEQFDVPANEERAFRQIADKATILVQISVEGMGEQSREWTDTYGTSGLHIYIENDSFSINEVVA